MHKLWIALFMTASVTLLHAQDLSYGFKAGLNFNTIDGPLETDSDGNELETFNFGTGFNIGIIGNLQLNDYFGFRGELMYSQKGVEYVFDGPSYFVFNLPSGGDLQTSGNRRTFVDITNSYVDIPVLAYAKFGRFELMGGVNAGFLIASVGDGSITYSGESPNGTPINELDIQLNYNFIGDGPGDLGDNTEIRTLSIDGQTIEVPNSIGAYYDFSDDRGNLFNRFDFGVVGGLSVYGGLFINGRINYGLMDITNDEVDVSPTELDGNGNLVNRSDDDRNLVIQTSIGFRF